MPNEKMENIINPDPYEGFSSCPDTRQSYLMHSKSNQSQWMKKSEEVIRDFITEIMVFKKFQQAYQYLANKRHLIACELKQTGEDKRVDQFGLYRTEGDHYRQAVTLGEGERFWKWQKNKIFELTYNLIEPIKKIKIFAMQPGYLYEDNYITCLKEQVMADEKDATYYCITIKFPREEMPEKHIRYSSSLSQINLYDFLLDKRFNLIRIEYTPIDKRNMEGNYLILDRYYKNILNWTQNDSTENFFINAAKLAFFTAHLLLIKHGNSSIIEWMLRAIAYVRGIRIGKFNYAEGISWDFKAILTPNINHYTKWFYEKLFLDYELLDQSKKNIQFSFQEPTPTS